MCCVRERRRKKETPSAFTWRVDVNANAITIDCDLATPRGYASPLIESATMSVPRAARPRLVRISRS